MKSGLFGFQCLSPNFSSCTSPAWRTENPEYPDLAIGLEPWDNTTVYHLSLYLNMRSETLNLRF